MHESLKDRDFIIHIFERKKHSNLLVLKKLSYSFLNHWLTLKKIQQDEPRRW